MENAFHKAMRTSVAILSAAVAVHALGREAVLFLNAHPDDTDGFAGTAYLLKDKYDIHVVDLTRGELGLGLPGLKDGSTACRRTQEEAKAQAYYGAKLHFLSEVDGSAAAGDRPASELAKLLLEVNPRAVFTHWPIDNHVDHAQCSAILANALRKTRLKPERYFFEEWMRQTRNMTPTYYVDITDVFKHKQAILSCYECQNKDDLLLKMTEKRARWRGRQCVPPVKFAEPFTTWDGRPINGGVLESLTETIVAPGAVDIDVAIETDVSLGADCESHGQSVQKPFETSPRHAPKLVMGREYWTYLMEWYYTDPGFADSLDGPAGWWEKSAWANVSLTNLPVFLDCGLVRSTVKGPPDPAETKATWRTVRDNCTPSRWKCLERAGKKDRPFVLVMPGKRNQGALAGEIDLDYGDWASFKAANTNLVCTRTICEWGNDIKLFIKRTDKVTNPERNKELKERWARYDMADRYDRLALAKWFARRMLKVHYGDMDTFMAFRHCMSLDHVAAALGAKFLTLETTNTTQGDSEYRWDIAGMFARGAARQFGLPWCWYEANYFNGPGKDGKWLNNSHCSETLLRRCEGYNDMPEGGTAISAQRRVWYYAYLNGVNGVESESWRDQFFSTNTPSGKAELTKRGRNFSDFHDFTAAHPDRGVTYAPVAILTPFAQGYPAYGGRSWHHYKCQYTRGDYAIDALFFTIAPGWEREKGLKAGVHEGNLHNSRFAMMYDVLVPDSPQPKAEFKRALFAYPAAILVGDYPDASEFEDVLADYEKAGGRLVRLTADGLPPLNENTIGDIKAGRLAFPSVARMLNSLQRELFPFVVTGDCQYGANRTKDGWWLWVFNNKGVRKFADTFETIDHAKDAAVMVECVHALPTSVKELTTSTTIKVSGRRFACTVPAGDFVVFEILCH